MGTVNHSAMRHIPSSTFTKGLWRNGRGVSWEIASDTTGDDFGWRFAIAEIASSGPFSLYGPVDRIFSLLSGAVQLAFADGTTLLADKPHVPHAFACDVSTHCTLMGGPARALNLFTARKGFAASANIIHVQGNHVLPARPALLFALTQGFKCQSVPIDEGDAVQIEGDEPVEVHATNATVYVAALRKLISR